MIWYCDSSALVKQYVRETGSRWFRKQSSQHRLLTSTLAVAEVPAALARRKRDGTLSTFEFHRSRTHLTRHLQAGQYALLSPTLEVIEQAALLIYHLPLAGKADGVYGEIAGRVKYGVRGLDIALVFAGSTLVEPTGFTNERKAASKPPQSIPWVLPFLHL